MTFRVPEGAVEERPAQSGRAHIRALTGVRIVAALWVVMFHIRGNLYAEFPPIERWFGPLLSHGELGVDLFFALSGYVLALNYVNRMGAKLSRSTASRFYWARLARVWPVFFATLLLAGAWHSVQLRMGTDPVAPRDFSVLSFVRQTLLVTLWTEPDADRLMWNGPAWSVSAEAFAYALFPLGVLVLYRLGRSLRVRTLLVLAAVVLLPSLFFVVAYDSMYYPSSWMMRILCYFSAGALTYLAVRRIRLTVRVRRVANYGALASVAAVIVWFYLADAIGRGSLAPLVAPLFVLLIGFLALGDRYLTRLLSTRLFVVGGAASYSVYMIHMLLVEPFWWIQSRLPELVGQGTVGSKLGFLLLPFAALAAGYLMWRFLEEPARHQMRKMSLSRMEEEPVTDTARLPAL